MTNTASGIRIINPGLLALIVDLGRTQGLSQGFSQSGALDREAAMAANYLCRNSGQSALIEVMGDIEFYCDKDTVIAITGPGGALEINGVKTACWQAASVSAGQTICFSSERQGQKHYIAVSGDWQVPRVAGSACTVMRERLGGLKEDGSPLAEHDLIPVAFENPSANRKLEQQKVVNYSLSEPLAIIPGYQYEAFDNIARATFFSSEYRVSSNIDRMGYRFEGPNVTCDLQSLRSDGINIGSVQVPPDGQPIIMMRDRQTLGGYPKLGAVVPYDIGRLAQALPGDSVSFIAIDANNARAEWLLRERRLHMLMKE